MSISFQQTEIPETAGYDTGNTIRLMNRMGKRTQGKH